VANLATATHLNNALAFSIQMRTELAQGGQTQITRKLPARTPRENGDTPEHGSTGALSFLALECQYANADEKPSSRWSMRPRAPPSVASKSP